MHLIAIVILSIILGTMSLPTIKEEQPPSSRVETPKNISVEKKKKEKVDKPVTPKELPKQDNQEQLNEPTKIETAPVVRQAPVQSGDCSIVNNYNWNKQVAYAVCMAESGGNPNATNMQDNHGSCVGSFGLMQVACIHGGAFYDPKQNMDKAYQVYSCGSRINNKCVPSWNPWGAYTNGSYMRYM